MDSKDDEQARGITMKSSSISLLYVPGAATRPDGPNAVPREERLEQGGWESVHWIVGACLMLFCEERLQKGGWVRRLLEALHQSVCCPHRLSCFSAAPDRPCHLFLLQATSSTSSTHLATSTSAARCPQRRA